MFWKVLGVNWLLNVTCVFDILNAHITVMLREQLKLGGGVECWEVGWVDY